MGIRNAGKTIVNKLKNNFMKRTNWTEATTNPIKALSGLLSALNAGMNAWIEIQQNGEQDYPIKIINPELNNPFNWDMMYGVPTRDENERFANDTERDLTENWTACFGEREAIEKYQTQGIVTPEISKGQGVCHPVRKSDLIKLRPDLKDVNLWVTYWKPKSQMWIADPDIKDVFVICSDDEPQDKNRSIDSAITVLKTLKD